MTTLALPLPVPTAPPLDPDARRAYLEALLADPRTNDGRRAWAQAELKRLKGK